MSLIDEADIELLISRLAAPLETMEQSAFRAAAYEAMARLAFTGPGINYRTLAPLQANHFTPPTDERGTWRMKARSSKLISEPPIEHARQGPGGRVLKVI